MGKTALYIKDMFDSGAQRSFISPEVVRQLELPVIWKVNLATSGFLTNKEPQSFDIARPLVQMGKRKCKVNGAVGYMNIDITVRGLEKTENILSEKGLKLARSDYRDVNGPYQLIIGTDYLGCFLQKMLRSMESLYSRETAGET